MKKTRIVIALTLLALCAVFMFSCKGGDKAAVVAFPKDTSAGYVWDSPYFDEQYFKLTSSRSYTEEAPGLPATQYHEWTLTPMAQGTTQVVFTQYDSQANLEAQTDPYRKVTITYEIAADLTVKELDRIDLNYKQDE